MLQKKVADYYKQKYRTPENPMIIPQVYMHYDPKDKRLRESMQSGKVLTFQRMDFLILYRGKRVIIEIDGKTHTPEHSLEEYSKQCKYDRDMKFLGYDVFRLGGYELTHNFEVVVKDFFDKLKEFLNLK